MWILVLIWLTQADVNVEKFQVQEIKQYFNTKESCSAVGMVKAKEIELDPKTADILVAMCLPTDAQTVSK